MLLCLFSVVLWSADLPPWLNHVSSFPCPNARGRGLVLTAECLMNVVLPLLCVDLVQPGCIKEHND